MKKIIMAMILLPMVVYAAIQDKPHLLTKEQHESSDAEDAADGLVVADSGLQIVPASSLTFSPERKQLSLKVQKERNEMAQKGYVSENSTDAQSLLSMRFTENLAKSELKSNLSDIELAFPYEGLPFVTKANVIGYTGFVGWDNGWLGIAEYFKDKDFPVCSYDRHNMKLSHGGVRLIAENLHYDVNNKPTQYIIRGNSTTGFTYYTTWYDPIYIHNLECVSETFKSDGLEKLLALAVNIDNVH